MRKERKKYITNENLLQELNRLNLTGDHSKKLHLMFYEMCERIISKKNFSGYSWKDDMLSTAYLKCLTVAEKFDLSRETPFSYFTTVIHNCYLDYIANEKKHKKIKDTLSEKYKSDLSNQYKVLTKKSGKFTQQ